MKVFVDLDQVLIDWSAPAAEEINKFLADHQHADLSWMNKERQERVRHIAYLVVEELGRDFVMPEDMNKRYKPDQIVQDSVLPELAYAILANHFKWWINLPWTPWGRHLWRMCKGLVPPEDLFILSAPMKKMGAGLGSIAGKNLWVLKELNAETNLILEGQKDKYAMKNHGPHLLIDDTLSTIDKWQGRGGIGYHVKSGEIPNFDVIKRIIKEGLKKS